jgi:transposase
MAEAIFYLVRSGCAWRMLPTPFPPWQTVFAHFWRWRLERTFAWLSRSRRLARDYERLPETGETMIHAAMSRIMLRRIAA